MEKITIKSSSLEKNISVFGGAACIAHTRIPVWVLVRYRQLGATDIDLLQWYPTLSSDDLAQAWDYYLTHREEIHRQIEENEAA